MMHVLGDDDESREWLLNHTKSSYHTRVRDTEIICRRMRGETLKSIGDDYGISRERVRQIWRRANYRFDHRNDPPKPPPEPPEQRPGTDLSECGLSNMTECFIAAHNDRIAQLPWSRLRKLLTTGDIDTVPDTVILSTRYGDRDVLWELRTLYDRLHRS
jgi:DNA-binding CsgD family transcriptional regulator